MKRAERTLYHIITDYENTMSPILGIVSPESKTSALELLAKKMYGKGGVIRTIKAAYLRLKRRFPESPLLGSAKEELDNLYAKYALIGIYLESVTTLE